MEINMNRRTFLLTTSAAIPAAAQRGRAMSADDRKKVQDAIPAESPARPKQTRRVLVLSLAMRDGKPGHGHASIPHGNLAVQLMGEKTGAYEAVLSEDIEMLRPEKLRDFDCVCFNNTTGVITEDPVLRLSLLDFVAGGKGFVGFHAAAATFVQYPVYDQFPAFGEFIGGYENGGHPWKPNETITLRVEDPESPLNAPFQEKGFEVQDEVFQFMDGHFTREKLHVLLNIDTDKTDVGPDRRILADRRKDLDFPITWIKRYGLGRVFYTTLGHNPHIWWDPKLLQHFLAGIQFALGDLEADTTPSITPPGGKRS